MSGEPDPAANTEAGGGRRPGWQGRLTALPAVRRWAVLATLVWTVIVVFYAIGYVGVSIGRQPGGTLVIDALFFAVALVLPLILVWLAAWLSEELARQRRVVLALAELTPPLLEALDATRRALAAQPPAASPEKLEAALQAGVAAGVAAGVERSRAGVEQALARLAAAEVRLEALVRTARGAAGEAAAPSPPAAVHAAVPPSEPAQEPAPKPAPAPAPKAPSAPKPKRPAAAARDPAEPAHPALPHLNAREADTRPDWPDLVRALDFPKDEGDHAGFRALREALRHRSIAQMLQSAEDVLTILAQNGVFMEEFAPEGVEADAWRRFQGGTRGAAADGVGGIRDPETLEKVRGLVRVDPIFRDAALFFQRRFDAVLSEFLPGASDEQVLALADTRSGRVFMLLARTSGALG